MIWLAFMIGLFLGAFCGCLLLAMCMVGKQADGPADMVGPPRLPREWRA